MRKTLLFVLLVAFLALAGCPQELAQGSLEEKVRAFPAVRAAMAEVPDAELIVAVWDEGTVEAIKKELDAECGREMPVKFYYRVEIKNPSKDIVLYLDASTEEVECRSEKTPSKPVEGPDYVPPDEVPKPPVKPPTDLKYFLEVYDEAGAPIRETNVRIEKLICETAEVCIPRTVVDTKTDLVGRVRDLEIGVFSNSTLFVQGYHSFNSDAFRKLTGGFRAYAKPVVTEKSLLPFTVKFFDSETGANLQGGAATMKFEPAEVGAFKPISPEGAVEVTSEDFAAAGKKAVDEFGNLLFKQIIFEVEGVEEVGVLRALTKPFFVETRENTYGPFETIVTPKEWDLRNKEVLLRLHQVIPKSANQVVYEFPLAAGKNYLTIPLRIPEGYSAEKFLTDIEKQGLSCTGVSVYEIQDWHKHSKGSIARNFYMENGVAYLLECDTAGTYKMRGEHIYEPLGVSLHLGFNYVGATAYTEGKPVGRLVEGCDPKGMQKIFPNGSAGTIPDSTPAALGEVYIVVCEVGGTWDKKV